MTLDQLGASIVAERVNPYKSTVSNTAIAAASVFYVFSTVSAPLAAEFRPLEPSNQFTVNQQSHSFVSISTFQDFVLEQKYTNEVKSKVTKIEKEKFVPVYLHSAEDDTWS